MLRRVPLFLRCAVLCLGALALSACGGKGAHKTEEPAEHGEAVEKTQETSVSKLAVEPDSKPDATAEVITEALNSLTPEEGIAQTAKALGEFHTASEAARLHAAAAQLYARVQPPDSARMQMEFEQARSLAPDRETRQEVALAEARALLDKGDENDAFARLTGALAEPGEVTAAELRLVLLLGGVYAQRNEEPKAEESYKHAFDRAIERVPQLDAEAADVVRVLALRLSAIYRKGGHAEEADALARDLKTKLSGEGEGESETSPKPGAEPPAAEAHETHTETEALK